jgi:hypothetical protein
MTAAAFEPPSPASPSPAAEPALLLPVPEWPRLDGGPPALTLVFRLLDGETVAEGYTSPDRLVAGCGPAQPWVAVQLAESVRLLAQAGATMLLVDAGIVEEAIEVDLAAAAAVLAAGPVSKPFAGRAP